MSETPKAVFDASRQFVVPIISGGRKECKVRFPTDAEWCARARRQRSVRRFLGRGKSESQDIDTSTVDLELFEAIRVDKDGASFDAADAANVLSKLERASIEECAPDGAGYCISLKVAGGIVEHLVRIPTQAQIQQYETASVRVVGQRRSQEIRGFLEPSGELYDLIFVSQSGYPKDKPVPIVHKVAVISEIVQQIAVDDEDVIPEA